MAQFTFNDFINANIAPKGADHISVYDNEGNIVGTIPLGHLQPQEEEPLYKFGLLSDIHVDTSDYNYSQYINTYPYSDEGQGDFQRAIKWLLDNENVDMFCACGDLSQNGTTSEFAMPQGVISNYLPTSKGVPFYTCTGNHDVKTAGGNGFGTYFLRSFEQSWTGMTNFERSTAFNESFCFDKAVGDKTDHFIFFSMYSYSLGSTASPYNDADITWLRGKLDAWKNERVFVFTHLFFPDYAGNLGRVNGSGGIYPSGNWLGGSQLTTLSGFLSAYPNAIWFSGHSHWKWDLQRYQKNLNVDRYGTNGAWTVHVPSLALPIDSDYTNLNSETEANRVEKPLESQGGVVYVYADRIEIRGIDFNINASQNGDTTRGFSGDTYTKYLPIAHYNMSTILKTVAGRNDPVEGYYIAQGNKATGETITKQDDYIILTYNALSQCVVCTNGLLSADDEANGATVTAEDIKVIYGGQEIELANVQNYGIYMDAASSEGGGAYANLSDLMNSGVTGASVQSFPSVDSNNQNSATRYGIQFNVSSRFITGNTWCDALDASNELVVKIKDLRINGVLVNTQSGNIGGVTYEMVNIPYADINSMAVGDSKEVIMVNPHRNNGYILGHNGSAAVSEGNGFATEAAMKEAAYGVKDDNNYHMIISKEQGYYTLTSKVGNMSPTGTRAAAGWSSTPMHYTIENATSLASHTELTSGVATTNNPNLIRFKNPSNNYLNAGGGLSSLKFAKGTGEWSVWYLYDANAGSASSSSEQ